MGDEGRNVEAHIIQKLKSMCPKGIQYRNESNTSQYVPTTQVISFFFILFHSNTSSNKGKAPKENNRKTNHHICFLKKGIETSKVNATGMIHVPEVDLKTMSTINETASKACVEATVQSSYDFMISFLPIIVIAIFRT